MGNCNEENSDSNLIPDESNDFLRKLFLNSLRELYYTESEMIAGAERIKDKVPSNKLKNLLTDHLLIHFKHLDRLKMIFELANQQIEFKKSDSIDGLLTDIRTHLAIFEDDIPNWELSLILGSQKLAYHKIASYGGLATIALHLNCSRTAVLLAICAQEEEEFTSRHLSGIFDEIIAAANNTDQIDPTKL